MEKRTEQNGSKLPTCPFCGREALSFETTIEAKTWEDEAWAVSCANCPAEIVVTHESDGEPLTREQMRMKAEEAWKRRVVV